MKTGTYWGYAVTRVSIWFLVALLSFSFLQMFTNSHAVFAGSNTYPAPWAPPAAQDSMFDTWREYNRECTSYVAWMLHSTSNFEMPFFADAINWGTKASALGYAVNMSPAVGSVYWSTSHDHVAWVESISSDRNTVTLQDFNSGYPTNPGYYAEHTGVSTSSASGYIHFKDFQPPPPPPPAYTGVGNATFQGSGQLNRGQTLQSNQYMTSGNVMYAFMMQSDGNLVLYGSGTSLWGSGTSGNPGAYLLMQNDGNMVIYSSSGNPLWGSGTNGQNLANLTVQSDGNVVINNTNGASIWATGTGSHATYTYYGSDRVAQGQQLPSGNFIVSSDKRYALLMQTDGNLVVYSAGYHSIWGSGTNGNSGAHLLLQNDGNMVIYSSSGNPLWGSNTVGQNLAYLLIQTDGNLVAYTTGNTPIWATNTSGKI